MTGFTASKGSVYLAGSALSDHRVDELLTFFEVREAEAEKTASEARKAFNELWEASCLATDYRQDQAAARCLAVGDVEGLIRLVGSSQSQPLGRGCACNSTLNAI